MKTIELTAFKIKKFSADFCALKSTCELSDLIGENKEILWKMVHQPTYKPFYITKKAGGQRYVEDPTHELKQIQRTLNDYLQSVYYVTKTSAAYGFVMAVPEDKSPRNILSNAQQHLNKPWMLNVDFTDFFHAIDSSSVEQIFKDEPFGFNNKMVSMLTKLTTFQDRLPMGAPTSPVLSNFRTRDLDHSLLDFCNTNGITYTRFADDLTFSANSEIGADEFTQIEAFCKVFGFKINANKTKVFGPNDTKVVTGLHLKNNEVQLPDGYYQKLERDIQKLADVMLMQFQAGYRNTHWVNKYQQRVRGAVEFAGFVLGKKTYDYQQLADAYDRAVSPMADDYEAHSWLDFNYQ